MGNLPLEHDEEHRRPTGGCNVSEAEAMHRAVLDNISDAIVVVRRSMTVYRNRAFARLLGFSASEATGIGFFESLAQDSRARVSDYHRDRASDEEPVRDSANGTRTKPHPRPESRPMNRQAQIRDFYRKDCIVLYKSV